ncbi:hypothetical protein ACE1CA_10695 [Aerosakkonemataceae cyanobacterium BLCC-F167]|uniref:Uncharacterized protein n=1 Tax=Floridaenema evergladense BLCC-F167 TaxID=3153639 RepID=A0ABV4WIR8_9CYAN
MKPQANNAKVTMATGTGSISNTWIKELIKRAIVQPNAPIER